MSNFLPFVALLGSLFGLVAIVAAWLFRTTSAPLSLKVVLPVLMVAAAIYTPFQVLGMMGLPVEGTIDDMPNEVQLISFFPHDRVETVDLWTVASDGQPRAYRVPLTPQLQKLLVEAREIIMEGGLVFLKKQQRDGEGGTHNRYGAECETCGGDYTIKKGSTARMPPKDVEE